MCGFGRSSDWYRNLHSGSPIAIAIGRQQFIASHRVLDEDESIAVLSRYEQRSRWMRPLVRRVISLLVGWRYDGSDESRRRVVRERPLLAFRPYRPEIEERDTS